MVIQKSIRTSIRSAMGNTPVVLPEFDYLVTLGSSVTWQTFSVNPILGHQAQPSRNVFATAGYDLPIINKAVEGHTIANLDTNVNTFLTSLGPISAADKSRVAVLVNIGANDIGQTDYDNMVPATRDAMLAGLNSIITKIEAFGFTPILATSNSRKTVEAIYEEWAVKFYRPVVSGRTPFWYADPLAVFDYCKLYNDNKDVVNWWNPDGVHPWMATNPTQAYTIAKLASKSKLPTMSAGERVLFYFPTTNQTTGGFNSITGAASASLATVYDRKGALISGASFGWTGAGGASGGVRPNPGAWNIDLSHNLVQGGTIFASGTITFTAAFGAAYANRTGTLRVTASSNAAGRLTKITAGASSGVVNASGPGVQIVDVPFTMDAAGTLVFTAAPQAPSTSANVSGVELIFN